MATQWLECGDSENAGLILWYAGGTLPGYRSGTWRQLAELLGLFPKMALTDCRLELLAAITWEVMAQEEDKEWEQSNWLYEIIPSSRISHFQSGDPCKGMVNLLQDYIAGLDQYLILFKADHLNTLEIALGYDRASRNNLWCRKHAFSYLRDRDPKEEIEIGWLPFVYRQQTLMEVILDYARKEATWDLRLAAIELLTAWNVQKVKVFLVEKEIKDLPTEYYHRARILRCALEGKSGYSEWI
jgi:hypothetical protein